MSAMLKLILIVAFSLNPLGAIKWVFSTHYGNGDTDAHYDVLSKNSGNGGVTLQVTTVANGDGTFQLSDYLESIIVIAFFAPN